MVMWRRTARGRVSAQNLLVPQGGFEPSTYRLRSDCSAVELLRRPEGLLPNFYQTSRPQLKRRNRPSTEEVQLAPSPFVPAPAFAGVNSSGDPESVNTFLRSSPRKRGSRLGIGMKDWIPAFAGMNGWKMLSGLSTTAGTARGCGSSRRRAGLPARARARPRSRRWGRDRRARAPAGSPPAPPPSSRPRAGRADHRPSPPPLRGARFAHQRRKGRNERPPRPLAALSPSPRSQAYPLAALAPSPRLRGEGGGEGLPETTQLVAAPHPDRFAIRPLPVNGER